MGYCRLCKQFMESPWDCDCRPSPEELGHDWRDAGDLGRDEYEHITGVAECNNCGHLSSEPWKVTEVCPA